ncbi:hypothetical protein AURDEDRAFT_116691 [Auricularia subglabra TFB-10046 SS5]|uniref:Vacuolar sorting protein 39/Transforming growth factor beta receptor-associated domain-containing protein n=1 Tax=Auricularia subglabra (strain TFB-10046 / SS5) TaxID=717982 RepID=J0WUR7_AURST|nr:hypothetical protein AURDEDRAFT_116691 [Auricularia subglabra TFB-10046 SS5]
MGALAGLGNYMTLGLGAKAKPSLVRVGEGEVMITREHASLFFGPDRKLSRLGGMEWPSAPEDISYVQNYLLGVTPGQQPSVHVRSSLSLQPAQTLPYPFATPPAGAATGSATVRLLSPQLLAVTPGEKNAATALWMLCMRPWSEQVDELVAKGAYADALALVDTLDNNALPDKDQRRKHIRGLLAVSYFARGEYDGAIDLFIELETNPARVVALYPANIAGRLGVPREGWVELFGGTPPPPPPPPASEHNTPEVEQEATMGARASIVGMSMIKGGLDKFLPSSASAAALKEKDADTQSIMSKEVAADPSSKRALETLVRYLSDRRQKAAGALAALHITPAAAPGYPRLSQTDLADVWALPDAPPAALAPAELVRYAQVVYTALFKSYLVIRPTLVGPLCRIENWCEVVEVEEELRARGMFTDLIDLYAGKKMHDQALRLLKELSEHDDDPRDKLDPTIRYLQKLPPSEVQTVFTWARWAFNVDSKLALNIFTLEESELPRAAVADYLEKIDPRLCMRFIEHLIYELPVKVTDQAFHDRLADLYLQAVVSGPKDERKETYDKLLKFISNPDAHYRPDRLFGHLPSEDLYEAKAILLGRLGRHEGALEIYVYKLQDYIEAEEYCKRVHRSSGDSSIFPLLLRILLRASLLQPALAFISRQSPRLDAQETIKLLPPLVPAGALREFLVQAVRQPIFDTRVVRDIAKARAEEVSRRLVALQERRVRVDDSRICPQCHKRIGGSVIAVHLPRGEVTHYQCREAFSKRLREGPIVH